MMFTLRISGLWIYGFVLLAMKSAEAVFSGECKTVDSLSKSAYTYWPLGLDCDHLKKIWKDGKNSTSADKFDCEIWDGSNQLETQVVEFGAVNESRSFEAKLVINGASCIANRISVDVQPFPDVTCGDFANNERTANNIIHLQATYSDTLKLSCQHPNNTDMIIPVGMDRSKFETKWMLGCKTDRDYTYRRNTQIHNEEGESGYPDTLVYPRVDFYDAGELTCSVRYNGRTLHVVTKALCVKQKIDVNEPSIGCTDTSVAKGETALVDCKGILPNGITFANDFVVEWKKNDMVVCSAILFNVNSEGSERHSCVVNGKNESLICVKDGRAVDNPSYSDQKTVTMEMRIRDVGRHDYGTYKAEIHYKGYVEKDEVELVEDMLPFYTKLLTGLTVALVLLVSGTVLAIFYLNNRIYIAILCIKCRGRFNEQGQRVFLSYIYDKDTMTPDMLQRTEHIVEVAHKETDCYDNQREPSNQLIQNILTNNFANCHSVIIVLSPDYLQNEAMQFQADLAFDRLMVTKTRPIFIATGEIDRELREAASNGQAWKNVLIMTKVFGVFVWSPGSEKRLRKYIAERVQRRVPGAQRDTVDETITIL